MANNYYVARCRLCGWQWSIREDECATADAGCPACGVGGEAELTREAIVIAPENAPEGVVRGERDVTFR